MMRINANAHTDVSAFTLTLLGNDQPAVVKNGDSLLSAALRGGLRIPHLCRVGECGSCRCRLVTGQVRLKEDISRHVDNQALLQGYLLACQGEPLSDITLELPRQAGGPGDANTRSLKGQIKSVNSLNHDIRELVVQLNDPLGYVAGQYAQLTIPSEPSLADAPRCYSFSCAPGRQGNTSLTFHIRYVPGGRFTEWLFNQDQSDKDIELLGPLGDFRIRDDGRPMVCIAGGSGLAPIMAMLEELVCRKQAPDLTLFLAARTQRDLYCQNDLMDLQKRWPGPGRLLVLPVLSSEPAGSTWAGLTGYCNDHFHSFCNPADSSFYLCGPPAMIDAIVDHLQGEVSSEYVHYDRFLDRSNISIAS